MTEELVLVEVGGRKVLAAAVCPHRGGRLKYGRVDGDRLRITCPLHHTTFDLTSGERTSGAACAALRVVDVLPGRESGQDSGQDSGHNSGHDSGNAAGGAL